MTWDDYSADILEDGFSIERSTSPDGEYYSIGAVDKNITTFIDKSNNKREDQTYYYKLSGIFKRTWVQGQTVASGSFTCTKPTGLRVTHTECGLVRLAWNDYPFGVNETGYEIIRTDPNGSNFWIASVAANTTSYTITNTNYNAFGQTTSNSYKIAGIFNYTQTQYSDPVSASFTCPVPTNLKVVLSDCFKVNLAWDDLPISYSESGYIVNP